MATASPYDLFNAVEAALWFAVAGWIFWKASPVSKQQQWAARAGAIGFLLFGVTDLGELGTAGRLPLWLWGAKIACGVALFCSLYTWRGWNTFRWTDREFLFGLFCLAAVMLLISPQRGLNPTGGPITSAL